ncbi:hypothetical protein Ahy_A04g020470 [Arachis hypogaea]|uniref:Aminotransferase-like plant mobile domain-containing protein n=1 Tax=Arachis hypogaea TaxID=3818 RepID=A0A445DHP8_ARAHY|nr:hypothetical protein Ahy_A04g020470 [Arachis hypogaea]
MEEVARRGLGFYGVSIFKVLPANASEDTVRIYARAYIMMLLSTQLFGDKSANQFHIQWLPFLVKLVSFKWEAYLPTNDGKEQILIQYRLALDRLGGRDIVWELYTALDILVVVHPEILMEERFDRVVPQLGSVQHVPEPALNIDWLYIKDGRGGDRWFSTYFQTWHLHWVNRVDSILCIERVADPGLSAEYLD